MEKAFIEMINNNLGTIYKVCGIYNREGEHKQDMFQEIILQLWKSYPSFRHEAKINTWVYRVALNTAITNFRRVNKRPENVLLDEATLQLADISDFKEEEEKLQILKAAIEKLNGIEKAIIMLYLDEKTYDEIAEIVGITNSNVGVRLNRIKNKLTKIIKTN
jgi:RNA polymerase sigma-70 factor (ECF subfamily)